MWVSVDGNAREFTCVRDAVDCWWWFSKKWILYIHKYMVLELVLYFFFLLLKCSALRALLAQRLLTIIFMFNISPHFCISLHTLIADLEKVEILYLCFVPTYLVLYITLTSFFLSLVEHHKLRVPFILYLICAEPTERVRNWYFSVYSSSYSSSRVLFTEF